MNVQDFFSIVQLGVGIHAGTAILQLSGELGMAPLERRITAMESWLAQEKQRGFELEEYKDKLAIIQASLIVFKSKYDRLYKNSVGLTFVFGCLLTIILVVMSFMASFTIPPCLAALIVAVSVLPAGLIFLRLWRVSSDALAPIKDKILAIEGGIKSPDR